MRKYVMALALFLCIGNTCLMAQNKQDRRMPDKLEIIQKRTDRMAATSPHSEGEYSRWLSAYFAASLSSALLFACQKRNHW